MPLHPDQPLNTETVTLRSGETDILAYRAVPNGPGPYPVVVVLQEIFGVNAHIRDVTERIAREGYIAISPHLYHRQVQNFEVGYDDAAVTLGRHYKVKTRSDELISDIQAAIDHARSLPQAKPGGVGTIGFCFGGHVAYLSATMPDTAAVAAFYGAGIPNTSFGDGAPTLTRTPNITGKLYVFFGQADHLIPPDDVAQVTQALQQANTDADIFEYEWAGHGFFCDRRASYRPEAAADAWLKVKQLFRETLY
ncbi:MAG: dienelactone hydrolase family protein [Cyanobacteria bacterium J06632_22]